MYLLRRVPKAFGLEQFSIIDRDDQLMMFRLIRGKDDKKNPNQLPKPQELCDLYSFARNTRQKLSDALEKQHPEYLAFKDQIAKIMQEYETRKRARSFLDYDDILAIVASALDQSEGLVDYVASICKHMLVDEMQDTNPLQWALLEPLKDKVSLFCVGMMHNPSTASAVPILKISTILRSVFQMQCCINWKRTIAPPKKF